MSAQLDRTATALEHAVIEQAKAAHKENGDLPFVQHLEAAARDLCPRDTWRWEVGVRHGAWTFGVEYVSPPEHDGDYHEGSLL
jgi:hypothetical protein